MKKSRNCPQCGEPADYSSINPWRPFCSERCRLIDLGEWMEGEHRIPSDDINTGIISENKDLKH